MVTGMQVIDGSVIQLYDLTESVVQGGIGVLSEQGRWTSLSKRK